MRNRVKLARLIVLLVLCCGAITACASGPKVPPREAIVGKWVNEKGYSIEFYANGTGFAPGLGDQIPPTTFNYSFTDEAHILMTMSGVPGTLVEIRIDGDQMTWTSQDAKVSFAYTRAK